MHLKIKIIYLKPQNVMIFFLNKGENDVKNSIDNCKNKKDVKRFQLLEGSEYK